MCFAAEAPSTTLRVIPLPRFAVADKRNRSRDASAPELCKELHESLPPNNEGMRSAERRKPSIVRIRRMRKRAQRSPLASRRSTAALVAATERFDSVRAALHAIQRGSPSEVPRAPVVMPEGTMPEPPVTRRKIQKCK
jgi:hypothetical protein